MWCLCVHPTTRGHFGCGCVLGLGIRLLYTSMRRILCGRWSSTTLNKHQELKVTVATTTLTLHMSSRSSVIFHFTGEFVINVELVVAKEVSLGCLCSFLSQHVTLHLLQHPLWKRLYSFCSFGMGVSSDPLIYLSIFYHKGIWWRMGEQDTASYLCLHAHTCRRGHVSTHVFI